MTEKRYYTFMLPIQDMKTAGASVWRPVGGSPLKITDKQHYTYTWSALPNELKGTYININLVFEGGEFKGINVKVLRPLTVKAGKLHLIIEIHEGSYRDMVRQARKAKETMKLFDFNLCIDEDSPGLEEKEEILEELQQHIRDLWKKL